MVGGHGSPPNSATNSGPQLKFKPIWLWVKTYGTILGVGAPPILEPKWIGILTHGHIGPQSICPSPASSPRKL